MNVNERITNDILNSMIPYLDDKQLEKLKSSLYIHLGRVNIVEDDNKNSLVQYDDRNKKLLEEFINTKKLEGKSEGTLYNYYRHNIKMLTYLDKYVGNINTRDIRMYLNMYKEEHKVCNSTLQGILRAVSSFFNWLEDEDIIEKSPARRIKNIKVTKVIKKPYTEEELIKIKEAALRCRYSNRDIAMIEFLNTTGCRVSELTALNVEDINWEDKSCIVYGKGDKYRYVYLNDTTIYYLRKYLNEGKITRITGPLFLSRSGTRIRKDDVERNLRNIGKLCGVENVHPHRFRRTLACRLINRGVPIQEIMVLLGHSKIDTTMIYCNIENDNVRMAHKKYAS